MSQNDNTSLTASSIGPTSSAWDSIQDRSTMQTIGTELSRTAMDSTSASEVISKMRDENPHSFVGQEQAVQVIEMVLEWLQLVKDDLPCMSVWQNRSDAKLDPELSQRLVSLFQGAVYHTVKSGVTRVFRQDPPVIELNRHTLDLMAEVFTDLYFRYPAWLKEWVQAVTYDDRDMDVITKFGSEGKMIAGRIKDLDKVKKAKRPQEQQEAEQPAPSAS
ncbi:hypothetical protein HD553DRAFT_105632 [Filobasidium floriforme]|uniref:uncharacterized protein n=1 Tax=Filobasidium floriforme TaxID=5210 RepID=UPI001E8E967F|nr:uncharacterized protein HD553DRAFT_105632 [Filobasidium floriforme]KAH8080792.1 hypothetical protein HD553DRAFT_105632 [Filobasidium floriforme]